MKIKNIIKELKYFLLLWSSQAVSSLGTAMTEYALITYAHCESEDAGLPIQLKHIKRNFLFDKE